MRHLVDLVLSKADVQKLSGSSGPQHFTREGLKAMEAMKKKTFGFPGLRKDSEQEDAGERLRKELNESET